MTFPWFRVDRELQQEIHATDSPQGIELVKGVDGRLEVARLGPGYSSSRRSTPQTVPRE